MDEDLGLDHPRVAFETLLIFLLSGHMGMTPHFIMEIISPEMFYAIFGLSDPQPTITPDSFFQLPIDYIDVYKVASGYSQSQEHTLKVIDRTRPELPLPAQQFFDMTNVDFNAITVTEAWLPALPPFPRTGPRLKTVLEYQ